MKLHAAAMRAEITDLQAERGASAADELQDCYARMQQVAEAVVLLDTFGVEAPADLKELSREDVLLLAGPLKKVLKNKLLRVLGVGGPC